MYLGLSTEQKSLVETLMGSLKRMTENNRSRGSSLQLLLNERSMLQSTTPFTVVQDTVDLLFALTNHCMEIEHRLKIVEDHKQELYDKLKQVAPRMQDYEVASKAVSDHEVERKALATEIQRLKDQIETSKIESMKLSDWKR